MIIKQFHRDEQTIEYGANLRGYRLEYIKITRTESERDSDDARAKYLSTTVMPAVIGKTIETEYDLKTETLTLRRK